ncbi:MAG: complex I NDUFA9 subunit family protein [Chromatiaceae bacterium]
MRIPFGTRARSAAPDVSVKTGLDNMMAHHNICILGGTGFVGHHLLARLSRSGHRCRVLTRRPERHRDLRLAPGAEVLQANVFDRQSLAERLGGCSVVINLIGILNEGKVQTFEQVHVALVDRIGEAARTAGVQRFLQMSALGADAATGKSRYLRSKGEGEARAHAQEGLRVTSFRPSVIFGRGDSFFNRFAALLRLVPGVFPLACPDARFAPVYVGDVTAAMEATLDDPGTWGKAYDLCGPRAFSLRQLVEYTAHTIGRKPRIVGLGNAASRLQARIFQHLPGKPFTLDNYLSMQTPSTCERNGLSDLAISATDMDTVVPLYLA